jgi:hypothetical protein
MKSMSLWLKRKDSEGKTHFYAIPFVPFVIVALFGILIALLLPFAQAIRAWLSAVH